MSKGREECKFVVKTGVICDAVERGKSVRSQAELGRGWHQRTQINKLARILDCNL